MKSFRIAAVWLLLFFCLAMPGSAVAAPQILTDERSFDFGELKEGQIVAHTFSFVNKGSEVLQILEVKPS